MESTVDLESIAANSATHSRRKQVEEQWGRGFMAGRISDGDLAAFCLQLSVLLSARVTLHHALDILKRQTNREAMKRVVVAILDDVRRGTTVSRALSRHPHVFDAVFVGTVEVGEETGSLAEVLTHLARYQEMLHALKRKFLQALTYPALVVSVAVCAVSFLLFFLIPAFAEMFSSFQLELPWSTELVVGLSAFLIDSAGAIAILFLVVTAAALRALSSRAFLERVELIAIRLPWTGPLLVNNHVARFCRTLGTLLRARVSLLHALTVTKRTCRNRLISAEIDAIMNKVRHGRSVAEPLTDSKFFPPMVAHMVSVGEETSELDAMLLKIAEYHERAVADAVDTMATMIEPVLILFLGLFVAAILVSMYLPIFDIVTMVASQ